MNLKNALWLLCTMVLFSRSLIYSQNEGDRLSVTTFRKIYSDLIGEERTIAVSLPVRYETSGKRYPVLYILDAEDSDFASSIGIVRYLSPQKIPEMIIIGVLYPIHFTLNGEKPSRRSPKYKGPILIDGSTTLMAKTINGDIGESGTVTAEFAVVHSHRPARDVTNLRSGLKYKYLEQQTFSTPDSIAGPPTKSGIVPSLDLSVRAREQFYVIQYEGFIQIPSSGQYRFSLISNGAKLFIDNSLITSSHGLLPNETVREICLQQGYHAVRIVSTILTHPKLVLALYWEGPRIKKQKIPAGAFYY